MAARRFQHRYAVLLATVLVALLIVLAYADATQQREQRSLVKGKAAKADEANLKAAKPTTLPFTVRREGERWSLVTPAGKPFFSLGVCCMFQGPSREEYDRENPSYARWRYYDSPAAWAESSLWRLAD